MFTDQQITDAFKQSNDVYTDRTTKKLNVAGDALATALLKNEQFILHLNRSILYLAAIDPEVVIKAVIMRAFFAGVEAAKIAQRDEAASVQVPQQTDNYFFAGSKASSKSRFGC